MRRSAVCGQTQKRQHVLEWIDHCFGDGHLMSGVSKDFQNRCTFLLLLQGDGYGVSQALAAGQSMHPAVFPQLCWLRMNWR